jgi:serine/threonine protein kinase
MTPTPPGDGGTFDLGVSGYENAVEVGRGGFAVVYRAWQPGFDRYVAIKVVSNNLDARVMSRFERECVAIGALSEHPNIVTVHELGWTGDGRPFIVMEFLTGGSLGHRIEKQGPLHWRQAVEMTVKVAGALESAHLAGVLHRDVKPENVLVSRYGDVKLGDFGIARIHGYSETQTAGVTASWSHAPPEVINGTRPSVSSDIYSLGSTLYTLLVGQPPFHRPGDEGLLPMLARISTDPVPDLRPAGVPDAVCRIIERAMAKEPSGRQGSAAAMGRELQEAQAEAGVPVTALPLEVVEGAGRIRADLPDVNHAGSEDMAEVDDAGPTREVVSTFAVGAPPVPVSVEPRPPRLELPPAIVPEASPAASPVSTPLGPAPRRWRVVLLAVLLVGGVLAGLLVTRGGDEVPAPPIAQPTLDTAPPSTAVPTTAAPTTAAPTTAAVVRYSVSDELLPDDASEEVELIVDGGQPVRFSGSPPGTVRPVPLTVSRAGQHTYRLVVTTTSKTGVTTRLMGSGNFDVQEGRHFEVALATTTTVCLALERVCQE